jgi:hypothetical protein
MNFSDKIDLRVEILSEMMNISKSKVNVVSCEKMENGREKLNLSEFVEENR